MHIETFCPKCNARLHTTNFSVVDSTDEADAMLYIDCWACTWNTQFKVKRFDTVEED